MTGGPVDLDALLALATRLAGQAGALLREGQGRKRAMVETKSSRTDMVTEMDRAAEALIVSGLRAGRPDDAILGEEGTADAGSNEVGWLVDPIDGTTNYLYGFPFFAVSLAAQVGGRTEVAVVHDPVRDETFTAVRGRGARCNGAAIAHSGHDDLATALVGTGFAYMAERRAWQARALVSLLPQVRDVRRAGAASLDLCSVACGRLDGFYERGLQLWDFAAGALVASEAGAWVGDLQGGPASIDITIATTPALAEPLRQLVARAEAEANTQ